nr:MAG TPA: hypothetical protein [Caudoviricetes sp.]
MLMWVYSITRAQPLTGRALSLLRFCSRLVHKISQKPGPKTIPDVGVLQISENMLKYSL